MYHLNNTIEFAQLACVTLTFERVQTFIQFKWSEINVDHVHINTFAPFFLLVKVDFQAQKCKSKFFDRLTVMKSIWKVSKNKLAQSYYPTMYGSYILITWTISKLASPSHQLDSNIKPMLYGPCIILTKIFQETILIIFQSKLRHEGKGMSYLANFMSFLCRLRLFSDSKVCSQWGKFLYYRPKICLANAKNSHSKELNNNFDRYQRIFWKFFWNFVRPKLL